MGAVLRPAWCATVIICCTAPSVGFNIWPRVAAMLDKGVATGGEVAITVALVISVAGMAAMPFAMRNSRNFLEWLGYLVLGCVLACFNFLMAMEVATHFRNSVTSDAALKAAMAATLESRIADTAAALARLPQVPFTTEDQVSAARMAVETAATQAKEECSDKRGGRGNKCDLREAEQRAAVATLAEVEANRAVSARRERLEDELRTARQELAGLGVIPKEVDPLASRVGEFLSAFVDMGDRPDLVVIKWMPSFIAGVIELMAMWLPRAMLTATLGGGHVPPAPQRTAREPEPVKQETPLPEIPKPVPAPSPAPEPAAASSSVASAAPTKKPSKSKAPAPTDAASVRQFLECRTTARPGNRIRCGEVYEAYKQWCGEQNISPVSLTRFGLEVKASGVGWDNRNNRPAYLDIALVGGLKVVSAGGRLGTMVRT